jgi:hypothetical protein
MRSQILSGLIAAALIGAAVFWSPAAEMRAEADQIDFASLHNQANFAMQQLQASQERRMASMVSGEHEY